MDVIEQGIDQRAAFVSRGGMDDHAALFVDNNDVGVLIENIQRDILRHDIDGLRLGHEGKTSKEIAEKLDMNWMYISEIVKRFKRQGLEEFARNKYTSHNRKLSYQQEEDILQECERKAERVLSRNILRNLKLKSNGCL